MRPVEEVRVEIAEDIETADDEPKEGIDEADRD
jgi:hypothetical protein